MRVSAFVLAIFAAAATWSVAAQSNPYLGAWNLTGTGSDSGNIYWLEIKNDGAALSGMFLNRAGNPSPLAVVKVENGELVFQGGQPTHPSGPEYRARIENGRLVGHHTLVQGGRRGADGSVAPTTEHVVNWIGVRPPKWPAVNANGAHKYGTPVALFNGTSLDAFVGETPNQPLNWEIVDGVMLNHPPANNLVSKQKFQNFKIDAEYKLAPKSNSGIYLRGRYELQLLDDYQDTETRRDFGQMAIYGRTPPLVNASKPAGEWQVMQAIFVGDRVTATLNGQLAQNNTPVIGVTGGALDNDELSPGPLMLQGDHTQVWFRKVVVTPITTVGR